MAEIVMVPTPPVAGTNEVQTVTVSGTVSGGTFRLAYKNERTAPLAHSSTAVQVRDALRALNEVTIDGVSTATGGPLPATPVVVTFGGHLGIADVAQMTVQNIDLVGGGTFVVSTTTPGVDATLRGRGKGTVVVAESTGKMYINEGTDTVPVWRLVTTT